MRKNRTLKDSLTQVVTRPTFLVLTENSAILRNLIETLEMVSSVTWKNQKEPTTTKY